MDWKTSVSTYSYFVWRFLQYERLAYQHLFYESRIQFRETHNTICKACIKIFRHHCKVWEKIKLFDRFWHSKNDWFNASTIIWKSMTTCSVVDFSDADLVWGFPPDTFGVPCSKLNTHCIFFGILVSTTTYLQQI
jgi:hypothetical protein